MRGNAARSLSQRDPQQGVNTSTRKGQKVFAAYVPSWWVPFSRGIEYYFLSLYMKYRTAIHILATREIDTPHPKIQSVLLSLPSVRLTVDHRARHPQQLPLENYISVTHTQQERGDGVEMKWCEPSTKIPLKLNRISEWAWGNLQLNFPPLTSPSNCPRLICSSGQG